MVLLNIKSLKLSKILGTRMLIRCLVGEMNLFSTSTNLILFSIMK